MSRNPKSMISAMLALLFCAAGTTYAGDHSMQTTADVYQWWDDENPVGTATLTRDSSGITAVVHTSELPAGAAVTLWFIIYNHPEACGSDPCSVPVDMFVPDVEGDFYFGGGHVVGKTGEATFAGHLSVGEIDRVRPYRDRHGSGDAADGSV